MPSNFEIAIIALLSINFILIIYYNYRSQENYASSSPRPPLVLGSYNAAKKGYTISVMPYPGDINSSYMYSIDDGAYLELKPDVSETLNMYFAPLQGDEGVMHSIRIIAVNGQGNSEPATFSSMANK